MSRRTKGEKPVPELRHCENCGVRLAPRYETERREEERRGGSYGSHWYTGKILGYGVDDVFCTGGCAERFGRRCVRAGVRLRELDAVVVERRRKAKEERACRRSS